MDQAQGILHQIRHSLTKSRIAHDLVMLSRAKIYNLTYRRFLIEYLENNIDTLPLRIKLVIPAILKGMTEDEQSLLKKHMKEIIQAEKKEEDVVRDNSDLFIRSLVKVEGDILSKDSHEMLKTHFEETKNLL